MAVAQITAEAKNVLQPLLTMCMAPQGTGQTLINLNELAAALTAFQAVVSTAITQATNNP
jgi:hypothetical protein